MLRFLLIAGVSCVFCGAADNFALPPPPETSFWEPVLAVQGGSPQRLVLKRLEAVLRTLAKGSKAAKAHRRVVAAVKPTIVVVGAPSVALKGSKPAIRWKVSSEIDLIERRFRLSATKGAFSAQLDRAGVYTSIYPFSAGFRFESKQLWQRWQASPAISLDSAQGSVLRFGVTVTFKIGE